MPYNMFKVENDVQNVLEWSCSHRYPL